MAPDRWRQIEQLYHAALEREESQRAAYLRQACAGDDELRREVESLLEQDTRTDGFLRPVGEIAEKVLAEEPTRSSLGESLGSYQIALGAGGTGPSLGPYRIESKLGEGGMGEVFRAVDTRLGRAVAIKIAHEQFSARFEREARAISSLNHPHICTLYDVGPNYLVMELVEGETIAARLKSGPLPMKTALLYASQIAGRAGGGARQRASFTAI